jgi:hypothetical protein
VIARAHTSLTCQHALCSQWARMARLSEGAANARRCCITCHVSDVCYWSRQSAKAYETRCTDSKGVYETDLRTPVITA